MNCVFLALTKKKNKQTNKEKNEKQKTTEKI